MLVGLRLGRRAVQALREQVAERAPLVARAADLARARELEEAPRLRVVARPGRQRRAVRVAGLREVRPVRLHRRRESVVGVLEPAALAAVVPQVVEDVRQLARVDDARLRRDRAAELVLPRRVAGRRVPPALENAGAVELAVGAPLIARAAYSGSALAVPSERP